MLNLKKQIFFVMSVLVMIGASIDVSATPQPAPMGTAQRPTQLEAKDFCKKRRLTISGRKETYEECVLRLQRL